MKQAAKQNRIVPVRLLKFADIDKPVALAGCDELAPIIRQLLRGWEIEVKE